MKIIFENKAGNELADILCEINALIEGGEIKVGMTGLSPDAAKFCKLFYKGISPKAKEIIFIDKWLNLK